MTNSTVIERSFIGTLISTPERPDGAWQLISNVDVLPEHFADTDLRHVFETIMELALDTKWQGIKPTAENIVMVMEFYDPSTVQHHDAKIAALRELSEVDMQSDSAYMNSLAAFLLEQFNRRRLVSLEAIIHDIVTQQGTSPQIYDMILEAVQQFSPDGIESRIFDFDSQRAVVRDYIQNSIDNQGKALMTFPPAYGGLTNMIPQFEAGMVYVVSAMSKFGKSTVMLQTAAWLAKSGFKVAYFHLEDMPIRVLQRLTIHLTGASMAELKSGDPRKMFTRQFKMRKDWPGKLLTVHCPGQNVRWIGKVVRQLKPDIVIIDYIQKIAPPRGLETNELAAINKNMEGVKFISEDPAFPVPVILGSQEANGEGGANGGALGSKNINRASQATININRKRLTEKDGPEMSGGNTLAEVGQLSIYGNIAVLLNNDGPTGIVPGIFSGATFDFESEVHRTWQLEHPGQEKAPYTNTPPTEKQLAEHDAMIRALKNANPLTDKKQPEGASAGRKPRPDEVMDVDEQKRAVKTGNFGEYSFAKPEVIPF